MTHIDLPPLTRRRAADLFTDESGAATAEYAIATMASVAGIRHGTRLAASAFLGGREP